jgi:hypothetical protein
MLKKIPSKLFENVHPILPKSKVLSPIGNVVNKRKLSRDEVLVNSMIVPANPAKRRRLMDKIIPKLLDGTASLSKGYLLTPKRKIIEATGPVLKHFKCRYVIETKSYSFNLS